MLIFLFFFVLAATSMAEKSPGETGSDAGSVGVRGEFFGGIDGHGIGKVVIDGEIFEREYEVNTVDLDVMPAQVAVQQVFRKLLPNTALPLFPVASSPVAPLASELPILHPRALAFSSASSHSPPSSSSPFSSKTEGPFLSVALPTSPQASPRSSLATPKTCGSPEPVHASLTPHLVAPKTCLWRRDDPIWVLTRDCARGPPYVSEASIVCAYPLCIRYDLDSFEVIDRSDDWRLRRRTTTDAPNPLVFKGNLGFKVAFFNSVPPSVIAALSASQPRMTPSRPPAHGSDDDDWPKLPMRVFCPHCSRGTGFANNRNLERHLSQFHPGVRRSPDVGTSFSSSAQVQDVCEGGSLRSTSSFQVQDPFEVVPCSEEWRLQDDDRPVMPTRLFCPHCNHQAGFANHRTLQRHLAQSHVHLSQKTSPRALARAALGRSTVPAGSRVDPPSAAAAFSSSLVLPSSSSSSSASFSSSTVTPARLAALPVPLSSTLSPPSFSFVGSSSSSSFSSFASVLGSRTEDSTAEASRRGARPLHMVTAVPDPVESSLSSSATRGTMLSSFADPLPFAAHPLFPSCGRVPAPKIPSNTLPGGADAGPSPPSSSSSSDVPALATPTDAESQGEEVDADEEEGAGRPVLVAQPSHPCPQCTRSFSSSRGLAVHMGRAHPLSDVHVGKCAEQEEAGGFFTVPAGLDWEWVAVARIFPIKRVPKAVRLLWSDVVAKVLQHVCAQPSDSGRWLLFFALPKLCLRLPKRGGKKKQRAFAAVPHLSRLLNAAAQGKWTELFAEASEGLQKGKRGFPEASRSVVRDRVTSLVEDGLYSKAIKALDSAGLHELSEATTCALANKHPQTAPLSTDGFDAAAASRAALKFEIEDVKKRLSAFPRGSAPGASKWRAEHLLDALSIPAGDSAARISGPLTKVVNLLAKGEVPQEIGPWLAGAPLFPLRKKDGGVRPIAVGEVLRRLVSRCFCAALRPKADAIFLQNGQVGVGVAGGAEAAVQAVRIKAAAVGERNLVLKVDVENAFNTISRGAVLRKVCEVFPELEAWFRFSYGRAAVLYCDGVVLPFGSAEGVQQGDPLGPFLFALGLLDMCATLKRRLAHSTLSVWYLDDGTIVGPADEIALAWGIILEETQKVGVKVNIVKCEIWGSASTPCLAQIPRCPASGFDLLGSPIGTPAFCNAYICKRVEKVRKAMEKLDVVDDPQIERLLLRHCLGFPRFAFAIRSAPPSHSQAAVKMFDESIQQVCDVRFGLSLTDAQRIQWHLPEGFGGLGITRAADVVEAAYLGNAISSLSLVSQLLGSSLPISAVPGALEAFVALKSKVAPGSLTTLAELPSLSALASKMGHRHVQHVLSDLVHSHSYNSLLANSSSPREKVRLEAVNRQDAGLWLQAVPVKALGLKFDRDEFFVLLRWWLGLPIFRPGETCREGRGKLCGEIIDQWGDHAVSCGFGPGRTARHDNVNKTWAMQLRAYGFAVRTEVYTDPDSMRRSADTLVENWEFGKVAAHDWVISHTLQRSLLGASDPNAAIERAEAAKISYARSRCEARGTLFLPLAADSFAGFGDCARSAIRRAVAQGRLYRGNALCDRNTSQRSLMQRLQVTVLRGVARQLLRRLAVDDPVLGLED